MSFADSIESVLIDYLQSNRVARGSLSATTDLIDSGWLDSLLVMDLVCFIEARYKIETAPADINPSNLRTVKCLASYVSGKLSHSADAD